MPASACISATTHNFPEARGILGLNGAEIVYNPSATVAGLSEYLWELEQPSHAVANAYFVAAINRVRHQHPWKIGEFYAKAYFCDPRGKIVKQAAATKDELLVAELNLDEFRKSADTCSFTVTPAGILRRNHAHPCSGSSEAATEWRSAAAIAHFQSLWDAGCELHD